MSVNHRPGDDRRVGPLSRREFVRAVGGAAAVGGLLPIIGGRAARAAEGPCASSAAETAAARLHASLSEEQRQTLCFSYDNPLRHRLSANWAITEPEIADLKPEQRQLVEEIVRGVTSPDGFERFQKQMDQDYGGLDAYHIALFGEPGSDQFEFELTGRHVTLRADGNSAPGSAFGGPIVYGHGEGDAQKGLPGNVFYYQTQKANEVFDALDGTQRESALIADAPGETAVHVQGKDGSLPGLRVGAMSSDQQELVGSVMRVLLAPYREEDVDEAMAIVEQGGGLDALHMAFYREDDLGNDEEWDIWRIEGPTLVWHFRGAPHVHAYINIKAKA